MSFSILTEPQRIPRASDTRRAALGLDRWLEAAERIRNAELARFARALHADPSGRRLLQALYGNSPYLGQCLTRDMGFTLELCKAGPDAAIDGILYEIAGLAANAIDRPDLMSALRRAKHKAALTVAVADILGLWPLEVVTGALSRIADAALSAAAGWLLGKLHERGVVRLTDPTEPERGCGLVILGMGKLGAHELNYSSDIDLIVLFDPDRIDAAAPGELQGVFVRLTRDLVQMLEERTQDGYIFRTDLRLRPDPGATPLALPVVAAETYYESMGQNWERAAMIKARPVAGDKEAGAAFLGRLMPYVWRKHLDFAAIDDIHSIKRQIHSHRGGGTVSIEGHDIKLGRGGIREIEFFVQTQQLIWGGREPGLRAAGTLDALRDLAAAGRVAAPAAAEMAAAYRFLRRLEHRLQMVDDRQTHRLPAERAGVAATATFLGYDEAEDFRAELLRHLRTVERHYGDLFEEAPALGGRGKLVFTGGEHDPETLATLAEMAFEDPASVSAVVRGWHHGRYRATRSTRARELLTEFMPQLLEALAATPAPDQAFHRFDAFLANLPAGVQLFSLFLANPSLLDLLAEIMGAAPRLAEWLSRNPLLLDGVLDRSFFEAPADATGMAEELSRRLGHAGDMQDILDLSRHWANDAKFQVGVLSLRHMIDIDAAGIAFSDIADAAIDTLRPRVEAEFAARHGRCTGDGFAIIGLGKLGGRELTAGSDLDFVFVYDAPEGAATSDGPKPLTLAHYYQRLAQRLINSLTALTSEGRLYEVDMRLRPQGNAGPLATGLPAFARYHSEQAWTWEHLALTRARVVSAAPALARHVEEVIRTALSVERDPDALLRAVARMRAKIDAQHHTESPWRIKHYRGGLVDCEFIAQYLLLRHAHDDPSVLSQSTTAALTNLARAGHLAPVAADELIGATRLWLRLQSWLRLVLPAEADEAAWPPAIRAALAELGGVADFDALAAKVHATAECVRGHVERIIDAPARQLESGAAPDSA